MERVGGQLGRVQLAGREPAELGRDRVRADARGVQQRLPCDQRDGRGAGGGERAAALGRERRGVHAIPAHADRDADQIPAHGTAGRPVMGARRRVAAPFRRGEMLCEALAVHERRV